MRKSPAIFLLALVFIFSACKSTYQLNEMSGQSYRIDKKFDDRDPVIDSLVAPYKEKLDAAMNEQIGFSAISLTKGQPESLMGNWVCDVLLEYTREKEIEVDFAIQNYGGLRIGEIPKGPILLRQIYELMPFENSLVVLEAKEDDLNKFFERITAYGGWPLSQGVKLSIKDGAVHNLTIQGKKIDSEKTYKVAMPDYIANGGDKCDFFRDNERYNTGVLIRDILIEAVKRNSKEGVTSQKENRIVVID